MQILHPDHHCDNRYCGGQKKKWPEEQQSYEIAMVYEQNLGLERKQMFEKTIHKKKKKNHRKWHVGNNRRLHK